MTIRCCCRCHTPHDVELTQGVPYAVDVRDPLEAAVACPLCQNAHCPALLADRRARPTSTAADLEKALEQTRGKKWLDNIEDGG